MINYDPMETIDMRMENPTPSIPADGILAGNYHSALEH